MSFLRKLVGPKSKYDKSIPFTYMAKVYSLEKDEDVVTNHFSDTICGLIDYLDENKIDPENVEIFGIFKKKEIMLEKEYCVSSSGRWLERPKICQSLEEQYNECFQEIYKGHVKDGSCLYEDRERETK